MKGYDSICNRHREGGTSPGARVPLFGVAGGQWRGSPVTTICHVGEVETKTIPVILRGSHANALFHSIGSILSPDKSGDVAVVS